MFGLGSFFQFVTDTQKPKTIRKLIQTHFKKYAGLSDRECMFKFFEILKSIYRFDQERFECALGVRKYTYNQRQNKEEANVKFTTNICF